MKLTMSDNAAGDGAWSIVLDKLVGFTFEVRLSHSSFVGQLQATDARSHRATFLSPGATETIDIERIVELYYL